MNYNLIESELTVINHTYLCNYCGCEALEFTSYGHTFEVYHMCICEGSKIANDLRSDLYNVKQTLERIETGVRLHTGQVHHSIKQKLFDQEVAKLKIKYEMED